MRTIVIKAKIADGISLYQNWLDITLWENCITMDRPIFLHAEIQTDDQPFAWCVNDDVVCTQTYHKIKTDADFKAKQLPAADVFPLYKEQTLTIDQHDLELLHRCHNMLEGYDKLYGGATDLLEQLKRRFPGGSHYGRDFATDDVDPQ